MHPSFCSFLLFKTGINIHFIISVPVRSLIYIYKNDSESLFLLNFCLFLENIVTFAIKKEKRCLENLMIVIV